MIASSLFIAKLILIYPILILRIQLILVFDLSKHQRNLLFFKDLVLF